MPRTVTRPEEHAPVHFELTPEQRKIITEYVRKTGHQPDIKLLVDVVEDKIAPAAVAVGAA